MGIIKWVFLFSFSLTSIACGSTNLVFCSNSKYWNNIYLFQQNKITSIMPFEEGISRDSFYFDIDTKILYYVEYTINRSSSNKLYKVIAFNLNTRIKEILLESDLHGYIEIDMSPNKKEIIVVANNISNMKKYLILFDMISRKPNIIDVNGDLKEALWLSNDEVITIISNQIVKINIRTNKKEYFINDNFPKMNISIADDKTRIFYISKSYTIKINSDPMLDNSSILESSYIFIYNIANRNLEKYDFLNKPIELSSGDFSKQESVLYVSAFENGKSKILEIDVNQKIVKSIFEDTGYIENIQYYYEF